MLIICQVDSVTFERPVICMGPETSFDPRFSLPSFEFLVQSLDDLGWLELNETLADDLVIAENGIDVGDPIHMRNLTWDGSWEILSDSEQFVSKRE